MLSLSLTAPAHAWLSILKCMAIDRVPKLLLTIIRTIEPVFGEYI